MMAGVMRSEAVMNNAHRRERGTVCRVRRVVLTAAQALPHRTRGGGIGGQLCGCVPAGRHERSAVIEHQAEGAADDGGADEIHGHLHGNVCAPTASGMGCRT
eukprot:COSAG01_NODE_470_length_16575_cov_5.572408_12_plen_102_part_00